ncbi:SCP2 sterol-binding domain-containing protein [Aestuariispira insulae]|uniref:Putative sterol carrier protein n=1 Tax=Aestuariispira insulae TaxID=1461337 RepID=A0A3D9H572_9PROT|nr:SCP2 sterol-binding domain-containing protein [Aestuariispira insulae]RED44663.1 putative sterol carrier protein [Aestuariispira insulae]
MTIESVESRISDLMAKNAPLNATIKFEFKDGGILVVESTEEVSGIAHEDGPADCTVKVKSTDLVKMMDGKLDPMLAFTMGKLKVKGDMGVAMKLTKFFE